MSSVEINQVLAQMRVLSAQAQKPAITGAEDAASGAGFGDLLKGAINNINDVQKESGRLKKAFELGDKNVTLADAMIASQKAEISFQALLQVRNRMLRSYQQIMRMPI